MDKNFGLCRAKRKSDGVEVEGYYIRYETRQVCPMGDELKDEDVLHLIAKSGFADWNMPRQLEFCQVFPESVQLIDKVTK